MLEEAYEFKEEEDQDGDEGVLLLETINVTSAMSHGAIIWPRKAHIQLLQETLVPGNAKAKIKQQAKKHGKIFEPGHLDP